MSKPHAICRCQDALLRTHSLIDVPGVSVWIESLYSHKVAKLASFPQVLNLCLWIWLVLAFGVLVWQFSEKFRDVSFLPPTSDMFFTGEQ